MRYFIISIILFSFTDFLIAQDTLKLFLDKEYNEIDSSNATLQREAILFTDFYKITDKDMSGKMLNYREFSSLEPKIEDGLAIHYRTPGEIYSKGNYVDGKISGVWYYYSDDKIIDSSDYTLASLYDNKLDCNIAEFKKESNKTTILKETIASSVDRYLHNEFNLPARARDIAEFFDIEINFSIDIDKKISCIKLPNSFDKDLDAEIVRLLKDYRCDKKIKTPLNISFIFSVIDEVYVIVEDMPKFSPYLDGGQENLNAFRRYVSENIRFPAPTCSGRVFVQFAVDTYGKPVDVVIIRGIDNCPGYEEEILRVFNSCPAWIPGRQSGKKVKVQFTFPIIFTP